MAARCKSNGSYDDMDLLWKKYFRDPSQWYDNRNTKASSRSPDFKHKITKESLWIDGCYNPSWVCKELREVKHVELCVEKEKNDKEIVNNEKGIAFVALLKDCAKNKDLNKGTRVHADILTRGLLEKNPYVGNTLVSMYAKCGALAKAQQVFDELSVRDVVSWNALIAGYAQHGQGEKALNCFQKMQSQGISPNAVTFICILKACGSAGAIDKGKQIHDEIISKGLLRKDKLLGTALVDMYAKCGALAKAQQVFDELGVRDVVSWSALIAGYAQQGQGEEALNCFQRMQSEGISPDVVTFICILKACGSTGAIGKGKQIHDEIVRKGLLRKDKVLGNALVDMYAKCGALVKAQQVFYELSVRDVVSWNALITGHAQHGQGEEVLNCFHRMQSEGLSPDAVTFSCILKACGSTGAIGKGKQIHDEIVSKGFLGKNIVLGTALVDMYAKCGALAKAQQVFDELSVRDVVSWNALIAGYAQQGQGEEALNCFLRMQSQGLPPNAVTFICILKACGSTRAIGKGKQIHDEIVSKGLLRNDKLLGTALVDMYAKCGVLAKAQQVFDELSVRDLVSWNALIAGYAQQGQGEEALNCFQRMQSQGISPNAVTFICILKACGSAGAIDKGKQIHDEIISKGLLRKDKLLGTALVDMYAKCGALAKAQQVFDELGVRDVVSWSALIAGYAQQGQGDEALNCFQRMQSEGISPDVVTFICILKACGSTGAIGKGKQIHDEIVRKGLLRKDKVLGDALVDMYAKCGALAKSQQVFNELSVQDVVSWNALITGYAQQGQGEEALNCFQRMQSEGLSPDVVTFSCILKACGSTGAIGKGKQIHDEIVSKGLLGKNIVLGTALVDMYAKCGALAKAQQVFDELSVRDIVCWNALITGYAQQGQGEEALNCFLRMQSQGLSPNAVTFICILKACGSTGAIGKGKQIHDEIVSKGLLRNDKVLGTALVDMYAKCGVLAKAQQVFDELSVRNIVSWNALIAGYAQQGQGEEALNCFQRMQSEGLSPDAVTFSCILKACGSTGAIGKGKQIHDEIVSKGLLGKNIVLGNALVDMYAKCGALAKAQQVFDELSVRDVVSWNALIAGYTQQGQGEEALNCFQRMQSEGLSPDAVTIICILKACGSTGAIGKGKQIHDEIVSKGLLRKEKVLGSALVDMYAKCGALAKAQQVFDELSVRDVASWNALIAGYAQQGQGEEALKCFQRMQSEGLSPDAVTFSRILKACGSTGAIDKGKQIHDEIVSKGLLRKDKVLGTALVDMYAKCGALAKAQQVFDELSVRDVVCWNALITGYAQQGQGEEALNCFLRMQSQGLSPNAVTFICVLNSCSHSGLLDEAQSYFANMSEKYEITPDLDHHTCMVDVFGRAGQFDNAMAVIKKMPSSDYLPVWSALLGACRKWGNVKLGRFAFEKQVQLDNANAAAYVCMANIYASAGMHEDAENVEAMRVKNAAWKKPGHSVWVDVSGNVHSFFVGDRKHTQSKGIYAKLQDDIHYYRELIIG